MKHLKFIYGTAWKEDQTKDLVLQALESGLRAIDTANQRKHYNEVGVGEALNTWYASSKMSRSDLFLQTKFTFIEGQDHRLPYDPKADTATQVKQSLQSSLQHLHTDYLDSYLLHGPKTSGSLTADDITCWQTLEELYQSGVVKTIGVSNFNAAQLLELLKIAKIAPSFVQNRCYTRIGWDKAVRQICKNQNIAYQGFNLSRDPLYKEHPVVLQAAKRFDKSVEEIIYRWANQSGMIILNGSTKSLHLQQLLDIESFNLTLEEVAAINNIVA